MSSSGDDLKVSPDTAGKPTVECIQVDGDKLFLFDSDRLGERTGIESDCYVTLEEAR